MVLAERNQELVRNGRRSRGPSPNNGHSASTAGGGGGVAGGGGGGGTGTGTPETSSDDDNNSIKRNGKSKTKQSEYEEKIRVGRDYQAVCPPITAECDRKLETMADRALLVWSPTKDIPDSKLEEYISVAKEKYGYNGEQALGMLFWHKHDLERAVMDLANFTPFPDEWTVEDKVLFEQAFQFHGKSFHRIRQMLPDKSIASLVKYYYSWKKTRHRQSVMDRQEKSKASKEGSENGSENGSNEESDNDDKDQAMASTSGLHDPTTQKLGGISADTPSLGKISKPNETSGGVAAAAATAAAAAAAAATAAAAGGNNGGAATSVEGDSESERAAAAATTAPSQVSSIVGGKQQMRQQTPPQVDSSSGVGGGRASPANGAGCCINCGVACHFLCTSAQGKQCSSCHHHWRRTGNYRPTTGPSSGKRNAERHKRKPPRGMYINHDDIVSLASANDDQDTLNANTDREIETLLTKVQTNKQNISSLKRKNSESLDEIRAPENTNRINPRWANDELNLAIQGVKKHGKDFQTIADVIGTKTEAHVRTFFVNNRRRYNLDQLLKKHEADKEAAAASAAAAAAAAAAADVPVTTAATPSTTTTTAATTTTATGDAAKKEEPTKPKKEVPVAAAAAAAVAVAAATTTTTTATSTTTTTTTTTTTSTSTTAAAPAAAASEASADVTVVDESDNTTSSETTVSKSTSDEVKSVSSTSTAPKDNVIMEIDLDAEQFDTSPPAKTVPLSVSGQEYQKATSAV